MSLFNLFFSLGNFSIHTSLWVLLRKTSSAKVHCSSYVAPCRFLRLSSRKHSASSKSSIVFRSSWFNQVTRSRKKALRQKVWWNPGGLSSMNQQLPNVACVATLFSKEVRGENTGIGMTRDVPCHYSHVSMPGSLLYMVCVCVCASQYCCRTGGLLAAYWDTDPDSLPPAQGVPQCSVLGPAQLHWPASR